MSWLKNLGTVLNTGMSVATVLVPTVGPLLKVVAPKAAPAVQNVTDELPEIASAIIQVEAIGQMLSLPGPDKLRVVVPFVTQIILKSSLMINKKVKDQTLFAKGVGEISGGMADILNSIEDSVI